MRNLLIAVCFAVALVAAKPSINPNTVTVSGISAGAAFAVQYEYAYSKSTHAAGIIAGLPYYCAQGSLSDALMCMDDPETINIGNLVGLMNISAELGDIDAVQNIADHAVMLWSGTSDTVVNHGAMLAVADMYRELGVRGEKLVTYFNYSSEHAWITNYWGNGCSHLGEPFVNNCGVDFAGNFLRHAFRHMGVAFNDTRGTQLTGNMKPYNAGQFGASGLLNSMDSTAYYYVPAACAPGSSGNASCNVHINFHGCTQQASKIGTEYVLHTGLNQWAESNNIIVIYPQTTSNVLKENPNACFDWWGYDGSNYASKTGTQMAIVRATLQYLLDSGSLPPTL